MSGFFIASGCCTKKTDGRGFKDTDESDEFLVQIFNQKQVVRSRMETVQKNGRFLGVYELSINRNFPSRERRKTESVTGFCCFQGWSKLMLLR